MTPRTPLDLSDKSMSELMELDRQVADDLADFGDEQSHPFVANLLADRRQIWQRMEELRNETGSCVSHGENAVVIEWRNEWS